jgi:hypothetical protein
MSRAILATILASSLIALLQTSTPPAIPGFDPHDIPPDAEVLRDSCRLLIPYREDLGATLDRHGRFMVFWNTGTDSDLRDMDDDEIQDIIDDGLAMIEDLESLDPPAVYADGHQGIIDRFGFEIDYIRFLGIDASIAPNINRVNASLQLLYDGETLAATTCPEEVDDAGGYIFVDPDDLADSVSR